MDNEQGSNKVSQRKPKCKLIGTDGNVFALMGRAEQTLRSAGQRDKAVEMSKRIWDTAQDYNEALRIIMEYVEVE